MALLACPECRREISSSAATCPHCGQPILPKRSAASKLVIVVLVAGAAVLTLGYLGINIPSLIHGPPSAAVECRSVGATLSTGMTCTLEHKGGAGPVDMCWSINVSCSNGANGSAEGCGSVAPAAKSSVLVPYAAFRGALDRCDQASASSISNIRIK